MGELSKGRFATVFVALLAGMFVSAIDQMVVTTLSLSIVRDLGAGPGDAGWLVTTYLLASTAAMPLSGKIADLYGRKATYLGAMGLFVAGSLGAVLSGNLAMLAVMRGIQGVGGGALVTATFAVLADSCRRATAASTRAGSVRCSPARRCSARSSAVSSRTATGCSAWYSTGTPCSR